MRSPIRASHLVAGLLALVLPVVLPASPTNAAFTDHTYTSGHSDLGVEYTGGSTFRLFYDYGSDAVIDGIQNGGTQTGAGATDEQGARIPNLNAGDVTVVLGAGSLISAPAGIPFLSVPSNGSAYLISQINQPGLPFLGFGVTENLLPTTDWITPISFALTGFSSSTGGQFAVWQSNPFGALTVFMQTNDGISANDVVSEPAGVHDHFNLGFSQTGLYDITLTASGTRRDGTVVTGTDTFRFNVGPLADPPVTGTVPEPSSLALLGISLVGGGLAWARRRSRGASQA